MESRSPFEEVEHYSPPPAAGAVRDGSAAVEQELSQQQSGFEPEPLRPRIAVSRIASWVVAICAVSAAALVLATPQVEPPRGAVTLIGPVPDDAPPDASLSPSNSGMSRGEEQRGRASAARSSKRSGRPAPRRVRVRVALAPGPERDGFDAGSSVNPPTGSSPGAQPQRGAGRDRRPSRAEHHPARHVPRRAPPRPEAPLYRLYNRDEGDYFFTASEDVRRAKAEHGYSQTAIEGRIFTHDMPGTKPLLTDDGVIGYIWEDSESEALPLFFLEGEEGDYLTTDRNRRDWMQMRGWTYRGVIGYIGRV